MKYTIDTMSFASTDSEDSDYDEREEEEEDDLQMFEDPEMIFYKEVIAAIKRKLHWE